MTAPPTRQAIVERIRGVSLLADLAPADIEQVASLCEHIELAEGAFLTHEGEPAGELFILLSGRVSVSKKLRLPSMGIIEGEDRTLTELSADAQPVLGETAVVGGSQRQATIRCLAPCEFYRIESDALRSLMLQQPSIGAAIYGRLSAMLYERLELANTDIVKLSAALVYALES